MILTLARAQAYIHTHTHTHRGQTGYPINVHLTCLHFPSPGVFFLSPLLPPFIFHVLLSSHFRSPLWVDRYTDDRQLIDRNRLKEDKKNRCSPTYATGLQEEQEGTPSGPNYDRFRLFSFRSVTRERAVTFRPRLHHRTRHDPILFT